MQCYDRPVKVLQVAYKSDITGGERVLLQLCSALVSAGHNVLCACPAQGPLANELEKMGVTIHIVRMKKTYDWSAVTNLRDLIMTNGIDLVHTHGMLVNILGRLACWRAGNIPCVSTTHLTRDLGGPPRVGGFLAGLKNRWYYRLLDNWTSSFCSRVVAVSQAVREDLIKQGYDKDIIEVIPNGMDPTPFEKISQDEVNSFRQELGLSAADILYGVVARLSPQKDVATFLRAFAAQPQNCHAYIAGTGPLDSELKKLSSSLEISSRCHFLGFRKDVPLLLNACDVFVLSSLWEGLPLTVLEAMACSKAIVATAVDGSKEAIIDGETGLLTPPGNADELATKMKQLAEDKTLRDRMGKEGCERLLAHFHLDRVTELHLRLYEEVKK